VLAALSWATAACAQTPGAPASPPLALKQAFDAAWARQPEAQVLAARRQAAAAQQRAAKAWTPEPPALEASTQTDRLNRNQGSRELEVGLAVPLWLPGEKGHTAALAEAEAGALESRTLAAQLRLAAEVRGAWWAWQRARAALQSAAEQLESTRRLAADVARRREAGDLARADQHQAEGAVAGAEAQLAEAQAAEAAAAQQLQALTGLGLAAAANPAAQPEPEPALTADGADTGHAALQELRDRALVAERAAALARSQTRAHPELTVATTRDRGAFGERYGQTLSVGLRIPFGAGPRHDSKLATARADAAEAQARLQLEQGRLAAEREAARVRVQATRVQLAAAERRAQLARESRGFFDKSFRLGESDLPTRLRIEAEAAEAERQAARSRIELAAALSAWPRTPQQGLPPRRAPEPPSGPVTP
jgi:cobalt-zinc-cadmium efflux system outer membrane protein